MANSPKQKGTGGERELKLELESWGMTVVRTAPTLPWDLTALWPGGSLENRPVEILATRPDRGEWLFTLRPEQLHYGALQLRPWHIEVKRYQRFAMHSIFLKKFGPRSQG